MFSFDEIKNADIETAEPFGAYCIWKYSKQSSNGSYGKSFNK